ncbi:hypothetical protein IF2G_01990 [Cordyceps javanica]|nr:hypothetical protein IF2G_01990 [Cordyceps javanica]
MQACNTITSGLQKIVCFQKNYPRLDRRAGSTPPPPPPQPTLSRQLGTLCHFMHAARCPTNNLLTGCAQLCQCTERARPLQRPFLFLSYTLESTFVLTSSPRYHNRETSCALLAGTVYL